MFNIAKTMWSYNFPQNPDLNSSKINNAALLHLYSWLLISGELPHWFPNWFYWFITCWTNDSSPPRLFNGQTFIYKLYVSHGAILHWWMGGNSEETHTVLWNLYSVIASGVMSSAGCTMMWLRLHLKSKRKRNKLGRIPSGVDKQSLEMEMHFITC